VKNEPCPPAAWDEDEEAPAEGLVGCGAQRLASSDGAGAGAGGQATSGTAAASWRPRASWCRVGGGPTTDCPRCSPGTGRANLAHGDGGRGGGWSVMHRG